MLVIATIASGTAALLAFVAWLRMRPRELTPASGLVALGPAASGKTVLLSSMFHSLNHPAPPRPYHLECDAESAAWLAVVQDKVRGTEGWPAPTLEGDMREVKFDCVGRGESGDRHTLFGIDYLDHAGETLSTERFVRGSLPDLQRYVNGADALLGMIDGSEVVRLLHDPTQRDYFNRRLRLMTHMMLRAKCPIQLVVTKWDLVHEFNADATDDERLASVWAALRSFPEIAGLVSHRARHEVVRLIPVSAVGVGFAEQPDPSSPIVVKLGGGDPAPFNVEIPLAAVLPDLFAQVAGGLAGAQIARLDAGVRELGAREELVRFAAIVLRDSLVPIPGHRAVAVGFLDWFERRRPGSQTAPPRSEFELSDAERCLRSTLYHFHSVMIDFDQRFPSSVLRPADDPHA